MAAMGSFGQFTVHVSYTKPQVEGLTITRPSLSGAEGRWFESSWGYYERAGQATCLACFSFTFDATFAKFCHLLRNIAYKNTQKLCLQRLTL
jgi:hypothetical protein